MFACDKKRLRIFQSILTGTLQTSRKENEITLLRLSSGGYRNWITFDLVESKITIKSNASQNYRCIELYFSIPDEAHIYFNGIIGGRKATTVRFEEQRQRKRKDINKERVLRLAHSNNITCPVLRATLKRMAS